MRISGSGNWGIRGFGDWGMRCLGIVPLMFAQSLMAQTGSHFTFGTAVNPEGRNLYVDSKGLLSNGVRSIPVMGEIHFSRVPAAEWLRELLKMKAGGVTIVSTYIFWNHHETEKGVWDWAGNKDLRLFAETCQKAGLPLIIRIGPFCHGEAYQGGMADYIVDESISQGFKLRSMAPQWLDAVRRLYTNIFQQVKGLQWKDGGPIIGVQFENECRGPWAYYEALKKMATDIGFDTPIYTRTGWPKLNGKEVFGEMLPLYGDYADGFWDRVLTDMPGDYRKAFIMRDTREAATIATETFSKDEMQGDGNTGSTLQYPYLTCELGGGMMPSYHRRINIFDRDALALAICKLGSGSNLPGYYMYHGGSNPESPSQASHPMSEMQASRVTNYNDMPNISYDFGAPLGEMGQVNDSYHLLRILHQMLADWGDELALQDSHIVSDTLAYRGQWKFVNTYVRMINPSGHSYVQMGSTPAMPFCKINGRPIYVEIPGITPHGMKDMLTWEQAQRTFKVDDRLYEAKHKGGIIYRYFGRLIEEWWKEKKGNIHAELVQQCSGLRQVKNGSQKVAEQPSEADWDKAAVWKLTVKNHHDNEFMRISYKGDCARIYADGKLIEDNFWNGRPMLVRLSELKGKDVQLKILPMGKDYPIYLQANERQLLDAADNYLLSLDKIDVIERKESKT